MVAKSRKPPWKKKSPRKTAGKSARKLTAEQKDAARARAKRAGRRYPNLVDNMWAVATRRGIEARAARVTHAVA